MTQSLFFVDEDNSNIHIVITIELWLPTSQNRSFSTDISVTQLSTDVTIEGAEHATFPSEQTTRFHVEGNAAVTLQADANLVMQVLVEGEVSGDALGSSGGGGSLHLLYGDGASTLHLNITGDLTLLGQLIPPCP